MAAAAAPARVVPTVRLSSRLQLATTFFPCRSNNGTGRQRRRRRRGSVAGPPPAMTADVRVVVRRHFPAVVACFPGGGRCSRTVVEKVAEDIALRRRPSRALADDVIPHVRHNFDRGAVVAAAGEICAYVAAACADARLVHGGVHVLVLVDTFACPGFVLHVPAPTPCHNPMIATTTTTMIKPPRGTGALLLKSLAATKTMAADPIVEMPRKETKIATTTTMMMKRPSGTGAPLSKSLAATKTIAPDPIVEVPRKETTIATTTTTMMKRPSGTGALLSKSLAATKTMAPDPIVEMPRKETTITATTMMMKRPSGTGALLLKSLRTTTVPDPIVEMPWKSRSSRVGVIGDRRPKPKPVEETVSKGWLPSWLA